MSATKIRSDILFNRALLWLLLGASASGYGEHRQMALAYFLLAAYNVVKSFQAWTEVDE